MRVRGSSYGRRNGSYDAVSTCVALWYSDLHTHSDDSPMLYGLAVCLMLAAPPETREASKEAQQKLMDEMREASKDLPKPTIVVDSAGDEPRSPIVWKNKVGDTK